MRARHRLPEHVTSNGHLGDRDFPEAQVAVVASGSILLVYVGVCLAVIRVRVRDGLPDEGNFRLPFGATIPVLSLVFIGWLLSSR